MYYSKVTIVLVIILFDASQIHGNASLEREFYQTFKKNEKVGTLMEASVTEAIQTYHCEKLFKLGPGEGPIHRFLPVIFDHVTTGFAAIKVRKEVGAISCAGNIYFREGMKYGYIIKIGKPDPEMSHYRLMEYIYYEEYVDEMVSRIANEDASTSGAGNN